MRGLVLFTIVVGALVALLWARPPADAFLPPPLTYFTTARQLGVVGYRDPAGAISPDGTHFAYTEGRFIRIIPIGGGAPVSLAPADQQVRFLEWTTNGTVVSVSRPPSSFRMTDGRSACVIDRRLVIPCGGVKQALDPVDQDSGAMTSPVREVKADGFDADITHAEWLGSSTTIAAVAKEAPGRNVIVTLPVMGGTATIVHRYTTEHDFAGLGVSADGKWIVYAAPASDGFYQIFKKAIADSVQPVQLTSDPSNKTQPAVSPDGSRVAFTIWSYDAAFWSFHGR